MKNNPKIISSVLLLFTLFLFMAFSMAKKEKHAVKIELENVRIVYSGIDNPVLISAPGIDPSDLFVNIKGGKIRRDSINPARFFILPEHHYMVHVDVNVKSGKAFKTIASDSFRVKDIQNPVFWFGKNGRDCTMNHDEIRNQLGVFSRMVNCDFALTFRITSFSMSLYSDGKWNESTTEGPAFTEAQKKDLAALQSGDRIIFHHINVKGFGGIDTTIKRTIPGMYVTVQ